MKAIVNVKQKRNHLSKLNGLTFEVAERNDTILPLIDDNGIMIDTGGQYEDLPTLIFFDFGQVLIVDFQNEMEEAEDMKKESDPNVSEIRRYISRLLKYQKINGIKLI